MSTLDTQNNSLPTDLSKQEHPDDH